MPTKDLGAREYLTVAGHRLELAPTPEVAAFLDRLARMLKDDAASSRDMVMVGYSKENPFLDHSIFATRGAVTKQVLEDPAYAVMKDLIFRKELAENRLDLERVAARYSMTLDQAAGALGIGAREVARLVEDRALASWIRDGREMLDPRAVHALARAWRGAS